MKKFSSLLFSACFFLSTAQAQNTSPYWSLAGNSNADGASKLGTTTAVPLRLFTNNVARAFIATNGNFGIGTSSPQQRFHVEGPTLLNLFVSTSALGPISGSGQIGYTKHLPTASGQRLGYFLTGSRGGGESNYHGAGMVGYADGAWSATSWPAYLSFETAPSGSNVRQERMRITSAGNVGVGTGFPNAVLHINSTEVGQTPFRVQVNGASKLFVDANGGVAVGGFATPPVNGLFVNGNVGIGTSAAEYMLDVAGRIRLRAGGGGTAGLWLNNGANTGLLGFMGAINDNHIGMWGQTGAGWSLSMNTTSGHVGIGTIAPTYRLMATNSATSIPTARIENLYAGGTFSDGLSIRAGRNASSGSYMIEFRRPDNTMIGTVSQATATSVAYNTTSDKRLKANIRATKFGLADVKKIEVADYSFINDKTPQTGFIAQQLYEVFPEAVSVGGEDPKERPWMVDYGRVTPLLVKAVQELSKENEELKARLDKMEALLSNKGNNGTLSLSGAYLEQNIPNPTKGSTTIRYHVPDGATTVRLTLINSQGQLLRTMNLTNRGTSQLNLETATLPAGTYSYTLWVDGKEAGNKQLVIAR